VLEAVTVGEAVVGALGDAGASVNMLKGFQLLVIPLSSERLGRRGIVAR
jgi:hypothetical protein